MTRMARFVDSGRPSVKLSCNNHKCRTVICTAVTDRTNVLFGYIVLNGLGKVR